MMPGYVKCPKCHARIPRSTAPPAVHFGGTTVETKRSPATAIAIVAVTILAVVIGYYALRGGGKAPAGDVEPPPTAPSEPSTIATPEPGEPGQAAPPSTFSPTPVHPEAIGGELERTLKRMRLWATVEVSSRTVDVRSSSCNDKAMQPVLDGVMPRFKAAGLTRLRCVEQSGAVVFSRDL
jgi:hypothetical protein